MFCKRLATAEAGGSAPTEGLALPRSAGHVLSTVSHFNLIHVKCHAAARRADSNRRAPKRCAMPHEVLYCLCQPLTMSQLLHLQSQSGSTLGQRATA